MIKTILVHLATGFEETEAVTIIDVLRRANLNVSTVSLTDKRKVTGAHNISIEADQLYDETDYARAAMIILLAGQLILFNQEKRWIGAICAAPIILGSLGFLLGKKAVCYPGFESRLTGANVLQVPAVVDEHLVTGRGVGTALDFSLLIVRLLKGDAVAAELRTSLVIY